MDKALTKFLLSFWIVLVAGFLHLNAQGTSYSGELAGKGSTVQSELFKPQVHNSQAVFTSVPVSHKHGQSPELEAVEIEVEEDELLSTAKLFFQVKTFAALACALLLLLHSAHQTFELHRHFIFSLSSSALHLRNRVLLI